MHGQRSLCPLRALPNHFPNQCPAFPLAMLGRWALTDASRQGSRSVHQEALAAWVRVEARPKHRGKADRGRVRTASNSRRVTLERNRRNPVRRNQLCSVGWYDAVMRQRVRVCRCGEASSAQLGQQDGLRSRRGVRGGHARGAPRLAAASAGCVHCQHFGSGKRHGICRKAAGSGRKRGAAWRDAPAGPTADRACRGAPSQAAAPARRAPLSSAALVFNGRSRSSQPAAGHQRSEAAAESRRTEGARQGVGRLLGRGGCMPGSTSQDQQLSLPTGASQAPISHRTGLT